MPRSSFQAFVFPILLLGTGNEPPPPANFLSSFPFPSPSSPSCISQSFFLPKAVQGLHRLVLEMQSPKQKPITQRKLVYQTFSLFGIYLIFPWYSIFISPAFSLWLFFDSVSSTIRDFLGREIIYNGAGTLKTSVSLEIIELMRVHIGFWILRTVIRNYFFNQNI